MSQGDQEDKRLLFMENRNLMNIGIPKEIKNNEFRVGVIPQGVRDLVAAGHQVYVQKGAGQGSGISDEAYIQAGALLLDLPEDVYSQSEMIIKVQGPLPEELVRIKKGQILFTYLHLASDSDLTQNLLDIGCIAIAYETIQSWDGTLSILKPMSEIAGRMAPQVGAHYLQKIYGGKGVYLGGVPGLKRSIVTVIGGGVVGTNATRIAVALGAYVYVLDTRQACMARLDDIFGTKITTLMSNTENIGNLIAQSDLVIGAALVPGARAPKLVTRDMIASMTKGSVVVDVAIDQGGCFETSRATTHDNPVYVVNGVTHYCVANIPSVFSRTSTFALANRTLPYALEIAELGIEEAACKNRELAKGVNIYKGAITCPGVAESMNRPCVDMGEWADRTR